MRFRNLSEDEKTWYRDRAIKHLYPGLEPAFKNHNKMVKLLAKAFFKIDRMKEP